MVTLTPRKISEMKEVAYRPDEIALDGEDQAYIVIRNPGNNLTIFPHYRLGSEYPKTYGHFHVPPYAENYQVVFGRAGFLLQKMEGEKVIGAQLKTLEVGEKFTVPAGWGHVALNLGEGYLITQDDHDPAHFDNDYSLVKKMRGFAYYICDSKMTSPSSSPASRRATERERGQHLVEDGGNWKAVPNPSYTEVPTLEVV
ncbi:MAG TPA: glucose-6-phosphate isomerase family protein [Patescibacteria group bacterium]|nr:glucose-6-phosphate isomerase family protein [Patescibacteria group bacterium]